MGDIALNQPLTVVLPMYNRERLLFSSVMDILELSQTLSTTIEVVVIDDGSTDETYETACELARVYPQVTVLRQAVRQGLGAALDLVRRRLNVEMVVVHDGVSPVDASQIKAIVKSNPQSEGYLRQSMTQAASMVDSAGSRRFASIRALHDSMEQAHRSMTGFCWLQLEKPIVPRRRMSNSNPTGTNILGGLMFPPATGTSPAAAGNQV